MYFYVGFSLYFCIQAEIFANKKCFGCVSDSGFQSAKMEKNFPDF